MSGDKKEIDGDMTEMQKTVCERGKLRTSRIVLLDKNEGIMIKGLSP